VLDIPEGLRIDRKKWCPLKVSTEPEVASQLLLHPIKYITKPFTTTYTEDVLFLHLEFSAEDKVTGESVSLKIPFDELIQVREEEDCRIKQTLPSETTERNNLQSSAQYIPLCLVHARFKGTLIHYVIPYVSVDVSLSS
jgi:hypothetical protein